VVPQDGPDDVLDAGRPILALHSPTR
jgi:hypothetical protein